MRKFPFNQSVLYIAITKTRLGQPQWDICVGSASSPRPAGWKNSMAPWFLWLAERSSNSQRGIILYASNILKSDHTESYRKGASANPKPSWFMFNPLGLKSDGEFLCIRSSSQKYYSWLHGSSAALPSWLPHWMAPKSELWPSESCCSTLALALSRSCQKCAQQIRVQPVLPNSAKFIKWISLQVTERHLDFFWKIYDQMGKKRVTRW